MEMLIYKIKAILIVIGMVLIPLAIGNGVYYLIGSFVAWDWNPTNWWLFTSVWGRVIFVLLEISVLANIPKFWEELDL
jgi:hypothetical protein